jgi:hypothetical protein
MDEHQVVQVGHQFKDGVTFMVLSTQCLQKNMARADNCNFKSTQIKFFPSFVTFMFSHFLIFAVSEEDCHVLKAYAHMRAHART